MVAKDLFRKYRNLGRSALTTTSPEEIQAAIVAVQGALRSRAVIGKRARSLRGLRRMLQQKLAPIA